MDGHALRDYRREHGLTQTDLARLLGLPQATISRWETGATKIEHGRMLELALLAIANGLGGDDQLAALRRDTRSSSSASLAVSATT